MEEKTFEIDLPRTRVNLTSTPLLAMSSIEQLQQLTTDELCILCLDYGIPRYHIANLERWQLELRLHVAIISERARMRALDRFYGDRDDEYAYDNAFNGKYGLNELNDPRQLAKFRADFTAWKYLNMRWQRKYPLSFPRITSSRSRGGVDLYKKMALNPYEFDAVSTVNSEDFEEGEEFEESEDSENWETTDEISRQSSDVHSEMSEESEFMEADEQSTERQSSGINMCKQGSQKNQRKQVIAHGNNAQSSDSEESDFVEVNDQAIKRQSSGSYAQSSQKSQRKQAIDHGNKSQFLKGDEIALNRTERFNWMSDSNVGLSQERESDLSSEHEICTYNFLEGSQGDIDEPASRPVSKLQTRLENNHEAIGASRQLSQAQLSPWRYLIDLIFSNVQDKLISDNVGYSILCCTMVICTYVGFKLIK